jgi:hypothetical protein
MVAYDRGMRNDTFRTKLLGVLIITAVWLALVVVTRWLFGDGQGAAFAFFGTVFAFWVVYCVLLPTVRRRRLKTR